MSILANHHMNRRILIIEDMRAIHDDIIKVLAPREKFEAYDALAARVLKINRVAAHESFEISSAFQGQEGFEMVQASLEEGRPYAMAFVDMRMPPGWDGLETIQHIWEIDKEIQIVICTAYSDYSWEDIVATLGISDRLLLLKKPFDTTEVLQLASALTTKWDLARQARFSIEQLNEMVQEKTSALRAEIGQRYDSEVALRRSEDRYARAVAGANDGIWDWDVSTNTVFYSARWKSMIGFSEDEISDSPHEWLNRVHPEDQERVNAELARHLQNLTKQFHSEYRIRHKDGDYRWVLTRGVAVRTDLGIALRLAGSQTDINSRKLMEEHVRRSQRLDSIGTLAGGVAHDLNNTLAPILMGVDWLRSHYPNESRMVELIHDSAARAAGMVRQLLDFAKGIDGEHIAVRPADLLLEMSKIIKGSFPKNILLHFQCSDDLPTVRGDVTKLHQVLLNLCVNARDAMPGGGLLTLSASRVVVHTTLLNAVPESRPGEYLAIRVQDTGVGISPEIRDRMFDPFFTTKDLDKGTGLGLSMSLGIVSGHGGFLHVDTAVGMGSVFTVYLPIHESPGIPPAQEPELAEFRGRGEAILFVDDESALREAAEEVLGGLNFEVLTATDGADALVQMSRYPGKLRAVITDVHMPYMDGMTFVYMLRHRLPDIPVIVASGRLDDATAEQFKALGGTWRLDKPFTQHELTSLLKTILSESKSPDVSPQPPQ